MKVVEQDLEAEKEKTRTLERKIDALEKEKKTLADGLKAGEGTDCDRDRTMALAQGRVQRLERKLERRELAIAIVHNVMKLPKLPSEKEE